MDFKTDTYPTPNYKDTTSLRIMMALDSICARLPSNHPNCVICGKEMDYDHVDIYDHDGGWFIISEIPKQWLSIHCEHCGYDNSFTKLGVSR